MKIGKEHNKLNNTLENSLKNISELIDVNTVIGTPVKDENGNYYIPISKITFCILSGGGEYGKINVFSGNSELPYSAGNGAVVSVKPCGFLIKNTNDSDYKILSINENSYENIIDKATEFISKIKN